MSKPQSKTFPKRAVAGPADTAPAPAAAPAPRRKPAPEEPIKSRLKYIEYLGTNLDFEPRIGRVTFSKKGLTIYYQGKSFQAAKAGAQKGNFIELESGEPFWIANPKRGGSDRLDGSGEAVMLDDNVRAEYWREIRRQPGRVLQTEAK
jgi:hypothetical protein